MHPTQPTPASWSLRSTLLLAPWILGGCQADPVPTPQATPRYSITADASTALASAPGSDWSGTWSTDFVGLDAHYRITHLGQGQHVLESIAAHNAGIQNSPAMARFEDQRLVAAAIDGREALVLEDAASNSLCRQGLIRRPEVPDVSLWLCRDKSEGSTSR